MILAKIYDNIYLNLSKLCIVNHRLFFPGHGVQMFIQARSLAKLFRRGEIFIANIQKCDSEKNEKLVNIYLMKL